MRGPQRPWKNVGPSGTTAGAMRRSKEVRMTFMTERAPISVYLVDDVPELRELIKFGMEEDPGFEVVGEAGDGRTAINGIAETRPTAVLLDLSMPHMNGLETSPEI